MSASYFLPTYPMEPSFSIQNKILIKDVSDLLVSAFEGGSNYWYCIVEKIEPSEWKFDSAREFSDMKVTQHFVQDYALNPDGGMMDVQS